MNFFLIAVLAMILIGIIVGGIVAITKSAKNTTLNTRKTICILIPIAAIAVIIGVVLCVEHFSGPVMEVPVSNPTESSTSEPTNPNNTTIDNQSNQESGNTFLPNDKSNRSDTIVSDADSTLGIGVDWQTYSYEITDNSGYKFRITLKLTPFALVSDNADYLKSAWSEIESYYSAKHELPTTLASWDLDGKGYQDMYYSVGEVEIKNITSGWDITEASSVKIQFEMKDKDGIMWFKPFFGNSSDAQAGKLFLETTFKKNVGSFPLIILRPESFNPKNPNGLYRDYLESTEFKVLCQWMNAGSFSIPLIQE